MLFGRNKKTNGHDQRAVSAPVSFISEDLVIEGNVVSDGELHIDGSVRGDVQVSVLVIEANGVVQGTIAASVVIVRGKVFGPITAGEVHLHAGAHVEGDITNEVITVENGAQIYGSIRRASQQPTKNDDAKAELFQHPERFPSLDFQQDNAFSAFEDNSFRPIKVVRPR